MLFSRRVLAPPAALTIDPVVPYSFFKANSRRRRIAAMPNAPVLAHCANPPGASMDTLDTRALEEKIDRLVRICERLEDENRALRDQQNSLIAERAALVEKSELARSRVEAMITRLRGMEAGT